MNHDDDYEDDPLVFDINLNGELVIARESETEWLTGDQLRELITARDAMLEQQAMRSHDLMDQMMLASWGIAPDSWRQNDEDQD